MTSRRGRCNNVELCSMATTQRVIELPDSEPFICPRCSSELSVFTARKSNGTMRAVQASAIALAVGCIGYSVYLQNRATPAAAPAAATMRAPRDDAARTTPGLSLVPAAQAAVVMPSPATRPFLRLSAGDEAARDLLARLAASYLSAAGDTDIHAEPGTQPGDVLVSGRASGHAEAIGVTSGKDADAGGAALSLAMTQLGAPQPGGSEAGAPELDAPKTGADAGRVIGVDAMSVVVNPAVTLGSLTPGQLQDILSGKLKNWAELGGPAGEIHAYAETGSGIAAGTAHAEPSGSALLSALGKDPGGIGLVRADEAGGAHVLPIGRPGAAILPGEAAVEAEAYPLTRRAVLTAPADRDDAATSRFLAYAQSASAQTALAASGVLPLAIHAEPAAKDAAPDRLGQYVAGASPLSIVFHFDPNAVTVGRGNLHDVDRLAAYLRARHVGGEKLLLAGFADDTGTPADKDLASQRRAASVAAALARYGIKPAGVQGFGAAAPVAGNETAEGRDRNRRVEVYLAP